VRLDCVGGEANPAPVTLPSDSAARRYRLADIVRLIPVPAAVAFDRDARDIAINAAFGDVLGVAPDDYVPMTSPRFGGLTVRWEVDGRPLRVDEAPLVRGARGEHVLGMSLDAVRSDGVRRHLYGWASPLFGEAGEPCGAFCVFQDVGAQVDAERRYRELAELTPSLLFTLDARGGIDFVNRRWSELTGADAAAFLGDGWRRFVHPDDLERARDDLLRAERAREALDATWRLRSAHGSYRWIHSRAEPAIGADGAVRGWFGSGSDVDDLHRALDAMHALTLGSAAIASGGDPAEMLAGIANGAFGGLADACVFDVISADGAAFERLVTAAPGGDAALARAVEAEAVPDPRAPDRTDPVLQAFDSAATIVRTSGADTRAIVPLRSTGRTIGVLSLVRAVPAARAFDATDLRVIEDVALRAGVAIENVRLAEAARRDAAAVEDRYRSIADVMPQLMWTKGPGGRLDWCNRRWYEFVGRPAADGPYDGDDVYHPDDVAAMRERWSRALATGDPFEMEVRIRRADGTYRWFLTRATCTRDAAGGVARWYGSDTDVDDVRRATRTLQVFADLGESLTESLGLLPTVDAAMAIVVPEFADWGFINLLDEDDALRVAATYHRDPAKHALLASQVGEVYARMHVHVGSPAALGRRQSILYQSASFEDAARVVAPGVLDAFWEVGFSSVLVVPLIVAGSLRGTLNVAMYESGRAFGEADVPFFEELGRRLAPGVANAELYERERRVAQSFQEAALPAELPGVCGFRFDAIYEAGRAEAQIGGDWYDAFRLDDGRIVISIGDVAGSGLRAAVTMSNVRQAIRGVAQVHADPALMLEAADRTLRAEVPDRFVTAFVGVIDGVARTLSYASAGHPPPLVRSAGGGVDELIGGGLPLGLREGVRGGGHAMMLPENAFLVFYTDGLIESTHDIEEGQRRLRAAVADANIAGADRPALAIHDAVLVEGSRDDVAILTVSVGDPPELRRWRFDALDAHGSREAQRDVGERLRAAGFDEERLVAAELVIAELIGNTVRYAPGPIDVLLERDRALSIVHVLDRGPGFEFAAKLPQDPFSESGRGLFLIASLAEDLHVVRRPDGGSHARVVLR
jgi:PAS domain S-box-containing protein